MSIQEIAVKNAAPIGHEITLAVEGHEAQFSVSTECLLLPVNGEGKIYVKFQAISSSGDIDTIEARMIDLFSGGEEPTLAGSLSLYLEGCRTSECTVKLQAICCCPKPVISEHIDFGQVISGRYVKDLLSL